MVSAALGQALNTVSKVLARRPSLLQMASGLGGGRDIRRTNILLYCCWQHPILLLLAGIFDTLCSKTVPESRNCWAIEHTI